MVMEGCLNETGQVVSRQQNSFPSTSSHEANNLNYCTFIKPDAGGMDMEQCLNETDQVVLREQNSFSSTSNHEANNLNYCSFIKPDPDDMKMEQCLNESGQISDQQISLPSSHEASSLSDLSCRTPEPGDMEHNVNTTSQAASNEQIPLQSQLKFEIKEEMMYCRFCPYSDFDLSRLKFHTFTKHPTEAAIVSFGEADTNIKFCCVKDLCNYSTIMCTFYEEHLVNCCTLHQTLSGKEKERLKSTFQFVLDFHNKHCLSDVTGFIEKFSSLYKECRFDDGYTHLRKHTEHNLFSTVSRSSSLSDVQSSMDCDDEGRRNLMGTFSSDPNPVPVFILQNQNTNLVESQTYIAENISVPDEKQNKNINKSPNTGPSGMNISKSKAHRHGEMKTGENLFSCLKCDKCFQCHSDFLIHMSIHSGEKPFKCYMCDKEFSNSSEQLVHKRTHTGEKLFKCDVCDKKFINSSNLIVHKRTHTGEKPFKCNMCDKDFTNSGILNRHIRTHTGEKPFKCDECNKEFTRSSNLVAHKRTHTGEKPFKCNVCERDFTESRSLIRHKQSHTGEKPFKCNVCDKGFAESCNLIRHKRTHTGEKPFKCNVCDKGFADSSSLIKHKRIPHKGEKALNSLNDL